MNFIFAFENLMRRPAYVRCEADIREARPAYAMRGQHICEANICNVRSLYLYG